MHFVVVIFVLFCWVFCLGFLLPFVLGCCWFFVVLFYIFLNGFRCPSCNHFPTWAVFCMLLPFPKPFQQNTNAALLKVPPPKSPAEIQNSGADGDVLSCILPCLSFYLPYLCWRRLDMGFRGCFSMELLCGVKKRLQDISVGRCGDLEKIWKSQYFSWTAKTVRE